MAQSAEAGRRGGDARGWSRRARRRLGHSLKARLVAFFLLLALAITAVFVVGMQSGLSAGWRDAGRPLVSDYVDRLVAEIGTPPSIERAQALVRRLPITVQIQGPTVNWRSHERADEPGVHGDWGQREGALLTRRTADGHRITLGLDVRPWRDQPRRIAWLPLAGVLLLTAVAYKAVRRVLRPLDDIRAGAERFGRGEFTQPIAVRRRDELGDLATEINAMAASLHQMLEAKRELLLAISHELRSPITRARLNTELLPNEGESGVRRQALLRDLQDMAALVTDLLEGERLGQGHAALHREPTDLAVLVREALADHGVVLEIASGLPDLLLDRSRIRLLLRNLVDNAVRHGSDDKPPVLRLEAARDGGIVLSVRDFGPGVDDAGLLHLSEPFYRTDAARQRATGGVGLGLFLCRMVAQAHGGRLEVRNAQPGLEVRVTLAPGGGTGLAAA